MKFYISSERKHNFDHLQSDHRRGNMSVFPSNEEFDCYLTMQKKGEAAIVWEELSSNKIYRVIPAAVEVNSGFRCKLMDVVDADDQKISVWTPVDIYDHLIKYGLDSYFRTLAPASQGGGKRKSTTYESVLLTNSGKRRCLVHSKSDTFVKEVRKALRHGAAKKRNMETEKKKEQDKCQTEEKKID